VSHPSESLWHIHLRALARTHSDSCEWDISRMNGPCFTWIHHVAYMNQSFHVWVSHVTFEWHVTYEWVTWQGETSPVPDDLLRISVGIEHAKDLIADLEAAASDWMSHGPPQWVKLHMDESWHISMSYIAYGWVYQKSEVVLQKMIWKHMDSTDYYEYIFSVQIIFFRSFQKIWWYKFIVCSTSLYQVLNRLERDLPIMCGDRFN